MRRLYDFVKTFTWPQWIGVVLFGLITNALYDLLKPGVSTGASWIFRLLTLGSQTILDGTYATASSDPTPLLVIFIASVVAGIPVAYLFASIPTTPVMSTDIDPASADHEETMEELLEKRELLRLQFANLRKFAMILGVAVALFLFGMNTSLTHSLQLWRTFQSDMEMTRPYIDDAQEKTIRARFARVRTQEDYVKVMGELETIARAAGDPLPYSRH
jgi:hypothetical protein